MEIENALACQIVVLYRKPHGLSEKEVEESLFFRFHYQANPTLTVGEVRSNAKQQFEKLYDLSVKAAAPKEGPEAVAVVAPEAAVVAAPVAASEAVPVAAPEIPTVPAVVEPAVPEIQKVLAPASPILESSDKRPAPTSANVTPQKRAKKAPQGSAIKTPTLAKKGIPKKSPIKKQNAQPKQDIQPVILEKTILQAVSSIPAVSETVSAPVVGQSAITSKAVKKTTKPKSASKSAAPNDTSALVSAPAATDAPSSISTPIKKQKANDNSESINKANGISAPKAQNTFKKANNNTQDLAPTASPTGSSPPAAVPNTSQAKENKKAPKKKKAKATSAETSQVAAQ